MIQLYKELLTEFIKFKSISTSSQYQSGIEETVNWLENLFSTNEFTVNVLREYDNPVIIAKYQTDPTYKTCLIYGHYDVQPAQLEDGWSSDPFELSEREGRLYARGAIDNKGQVMVHIAAILNLIKNNQLGYNIKFLLEGNEETGSPNLEQCIKDHKDLLTCDFVMISDGEITGNSPVLELGFRGGFNSTLTLKTASNDLHSGIYGGAAPSSAHELTKFLANLYDKNYKVTIPGFYDDVLPIDESTPKIAFDMDEYKKITGAKATINEPEFDVYTSVGLRPSVQVTGIQTGYVGEGYRNGIPAKAIAKINFRLVKNQKPEEIVELFKKHIQNSLPEYVEFELETTDPYEGTKLDLNNEYVAKAEELLTQAFGVKPLLKFSGGGLPIVTHFEDILKVPQILAPLANEDCNMHGANENYNIDILEKSLAFSLSFFTRS